MGEENKVILHGMWASPYVKRVELALKVKGIPFEYIEEDLSNKSILLLKYNPIHKKVPVLVHNGKPVSESFVIIEYIDETWKNEPRLLPEDPYERSRVRFWASYIQQVTECMLKVFKGEEKALEEFYEKLNVLEDGIKNSSLGINTNIEGRNMGLLDIMIIITLGAYKVQEQVFGVKILDPDKTPLLCSGLSSLIELPIVKEITPPHDKVVSFLHFLKEMVFKSPAN
ncbi:glutathione S-transferase U9 [Nicotiana tabacum]|uniref:Glutathione S-transferase n=2 Tax=Nicotiana TaxID=4085 RepID=A0A1S3Y2B9_TOBAC|nr:PREDICTED: glutathione S-transferase U9-like [Nicotiana sylvestris]XP_016446368.1 PREDICTED: glutathione S-transferase U9-like [Nicotiana tabacum]